MTGLYVNYPLGDFCMNTTAVDAGNCMFEDFVAIPDLLAGAFTDIATIWSKHPGWWSNDDIQLFPDDIPLKTNRVSKWFCSPGSTLRRCAILIEPFQNGLAVRHLDLAKDVV